jgi:predicted transposase/invertase (TIGR01784 family)
MAELANPHDRFFKATFGRPELAADFLQHYLPAQIADLLDPDPATLRLRPGTFVDCSLRSHASDLLYQARLNDGSEALVYVLFEHKRQPEPLVAFQLLCYIVRIWAQDLREGRELFPVVPLVVYHGQARWTVPRDFAALFHGPAELADYWPRFRYEVTDLSHLDEAAIRGAMVTRAMVMLLARIDRPELRRELAGIFRLLRALADRPAALEMLRTMLAYVAQASDRVTEADLQQAVETAFEETGGGAVPTLAETWMQQGLERGLERGLEQGREEGRRQELLAGLRVALQLRFGTAGLDLMPEIESVEDVATLVTVRDALLSAQSPEDIRRLLRR